MIRDDAGNVTASGEATIPQTPAVSQRLLSLDAYRGLIMIVLATNVFGLGGVALRQLKDAPDSSFWQGIVYHTSHPQWSGCSLWDLILPSFMFMVGVSMPYSFAKRKQLGDSYARMFQHAAVRAVILVLLGVFLVSLDSPSTNWSFINVLTMIGLGYLFVLLLWGRPFLIQAIAVAVVLVTTGLLYVTYPTEGIDLTMGNSDVGVSASWAKNHLADFDPVWHKNADFSHALDVRLLNLFPREEPFTFQEGGYATFMFFPSMVFMIFGLMSGELLRSHRSDLRKTSLLAVGGLLTLALGYGLEATCIFPIIKRIVTPSFVLFAGGWCFLMLTFMYVLIDVLSFRRLGFVLAVVGMNSLLVYMMTQFTISWTATMLKTHLGQSVFELFGDTYVPMVTSTLTGLAIWVFCYWLYRQKIFIRV